MDADTELLRRALDKANFFELVLNEDRLDDWNLVRDIGRFLIRIEPGEMMGYALLARAYRHLGDSEHALEQLEQCRARLRRGQVHPSEVELFTSFLSHEEREMKSKQ